MLEKLAILDAGSQYSKVIDRKVRELNVESEILAIDVPVNMLHGYKAVIISGGPESVYDIAAPRPDQRIFSLGIPILGICYGMQLMNYFFKGSVEKKEMREDGQYTINVNTHSLIFNGLDVSQKVLLTHGDSVTSLADGFNAIAKSGSIIAAIENHEQRLYGLQFHPEVDLTLNGRHMLQNFIYDIAGFSGSYTIEDRESKAMDCISKIVNDKNVLALISGGVDSAVCAFLLKKALRPEQLHALHVDTGFMRLGESRAVQETFQKQGIELKVLDASDRFYNASAVVNGIRTKELNRTTSPEEKRIIIGNKFMEIAENIMKEFSLSYLVQGTLRPDLIESASTIASSKASTIKTHHNDTEFVRILREQGKIIEPLRDYHKDEVRHLGANLGLSHEIIARLPFPGPGLAVRILCADKPYICEQFGETNYVLYALTNYSHAPQSFKDMLNKMLGDAFNETETRLSKLNDTAATILPVRTVGVQGDGRSYKSLAGISGIVDWSDIFFLASLIPRICHNINRVVYIFGSAVYWPVTSITPTYLTKDSVQQLQKADFIVNEVLSSYNLMDKLSQVPVILFPVNFGAPGRRSIAIRPFITNDFMTGVPAMPCKDIPQECLDKIVNRITSEVDGISRVVYDLTSKPPATVEWE